MGIRAQFRLFKRDLRTTHLYFATYVTHISPPLSDFCIVQTEHTRAGCLDNPGVKGHFLVETKQSKGGGHILDTFFQMSQVCFQIRERCLELMWREGRTVSTVLIHHLHRLNTNLIAGPLELLIAFPCGASNS